MWARFREMNPGNPSRYLLKQPTTLHGIWDEIGLLYPFVDPQNYEDWSTRIPTIAKEITERHPRSTLPTADNSEPMAWARESNQVGIETTYQGVKHRGRITEEYLAKTREAATKRIALAGYRLAAALNRIYPEKK